MRRQLLPALAMVIVFTVLTGLVYPLVMTGIAQGVFKDKADGELVERDGQVIGSSLIGQPFEGAEYFQPRPSATGYTPGPGYAYGSNEGPLSERFLFGEDDPETPQDESTSTGVDDRVADYRKRNGLPADAEVPVDAVTDQAAASTRTSPSPTPGSRPTRGGGPRSRGGCRAGVVDDHTEGRALGFLGEPGVNVLELNLALDEL